VGVDRFGDQTRVRDRRAPGGGTAFVEVTDPVNPKHLGTLPQPARATSANLWRDVKVYKNHAFIVADNGEPHGMQVFDLTRLRDVKNAPVVFRETANYDGVETAHTIALNEATGFAYLAGVRMGKQLCGGGLHIVDVRVPATPVFAGCFADTLAAGGSGVEASVENRLSYVHDTQCLVYRGPDRRYRGREICFNGAVLGVGIADVTDKQRPATVGVARYPNAAFAHQGWLTDDQRYFFLDDEEDDHLGEVRKTRTIVFDVAELDDPVVLTEFYGTTAATDHNLYIRGRYMYQTNYKAGLRVIDVRDAMRPAEVGYFDTFPDGGEDEPGYNDGAFTSYPFFANGVVAVTSKREGLFLLRYRPGARPGR
jgi:choice-of-anchor B domain-containing protein